MIERLRSLFRREESETEKSDEEESAESIEYVDVEVSSEEEVEQYTASHTWSREVEIVHFVGGESIIIEYDRKEEGSSTDYYAVNGTEVKKRADRYRWQVVTDDHLTSVNEDSVSHRESLGSYSVSVKQEIEETFMYDIVASVDERVDHFEGGDVKISHSRLVYKPWNSMKIEEPAPLTDEDGSIVSCYERGKYPSVVDGKIVKEKMNEIDMIGAVQIETDGSLERVLDDAVIGESPTYTITCHGIKTPSPIRKD